MTTKITSAEYAQQLEAAGVSPEQATVHAAALANVLQEVAFASDLVELGKSVRAEIRGTEDRLGQRIDQLRAEMNSRFQVAAADLKIFKIEINTKVDILGTELGARIDRLESSTDADFKGIRAELAAVRAELVVHRWALGLLFALNLAQSGMLIKLLLG